MMSPRDNAYRKPHVFAHGGVKKVPEKPSGIYFKTMISQQRNPSGLTLILYVRRLIHLQDFPVWGIPLTVAKIIGSIKMPAVSLMSLLDFFCKYSSWQLNCIDFKSPSCRSPKSSELWWGGIDADIKKNLQYTSMKAQKSISATISKPSGADRGHVFVSQNHCHATKHVANASLPTLSNRYMEAQPGQ